MWWQVELCPGGYTRAVTFETRKEFVDLALNYRLHEFDKQVDAVAVGLACMVPVRLLCLFSWSELEEMVCGMVTIDVDMLRTSAIYEGCSPNDQHVRSGVLTLTLSCNATFTHRSNGNPDGSTTSGFKLLSYSLLAWLLLLCCMFRYFWEAFELMPNADRRRLVSFAYGRSRLPRTAAELPHKFKLSLLTASGRADMYLPKSHACFFHIELPPYTSLQQCREKLQMVTASMS
jgi:hypothetical protein